MGIKSESWRWIGLLYIADMGDGNNFRVLAPLDYMSRDGEAHTVPIHFVTDLASNIWPLRRIGKVNRPAVLHDYHYRTPDLCWNRWYADKIFLQSMTDAGVSKIQAYTFYSFVRAFGWKAWNKYRG